MTFDESSRARRTVGCPHQGLMQSRGDLGVVSVIAANRGKDFVRALKQDLGIPQRVRARMPEAFR